MSFFADLPEPEPPRSEPEFRPPAWAEPPANVLPVGVALNVVVARTEQVAVTVTDARAYPTGIAFGISMVRRMAPPPGSEPHPFLIMHGPRHEGHPRFGVGFADGRRVVFDGGVGAPVPDADRPIRLTSRGGGGGGRTWEVRMWLWPLPPEGPLTFALTWPDEGVEETTVAVDAAPIRAAAAQSVELWPDERPEPPRREPGDLGWSGYA